VHTEALGAVAELVESGACSLGIGAEVPRWPAGLERQPIARVTMMQVAAPGHPLARRRGAIPLPVLREHVQIVLADRSRMNEDYAVGVYSERRWRVLDLTTKHALLRAGLGWGGMPMHAVADDLKHRRLALLHLEELGGPSFEAPLYAIHRGAEPPGPAARWLLERLAKNCSTPRAKRAGKRA
jgi:DNA-binding transcriptional LysR family regulator